MLRGLRQWFRRAGGRSPAPEALHSGYLAANSAGGTPAGTGRATWAAPAVPPPAHRVWLGFADGTGLDIDPWSRDGRALLAVARALHDVG